MRLLLTTPLSVVVDEPEVAWLRAEDSSGGFGVRPGHADLVTVLRISVLSYGRHDGSEGHVALRGGVFSVVGGQRIEVASREAVAGDDLDAVLATLERQFQEDRAAHAEARSRVERLHVSALQRICRYLSADAPAGRPGTRS